MLFTNYILPRTSSLTVIFFSAGQGKLICDWCRVIKFELWLVQSNFIWAVTGAEEWKLSCDWCRVMKAELWLVQKNESFVVTDAEGWKLSCDWCREMKAELWLVQRNESRDVIGAEKRKPSCDNAEKLKLSCDLCRVAWRAASSSWWPPWRAATPGSQTWPQRSARQGSGPPGYLLEGVCIISGLFAVAPS